MTIRTLTGFNYYMVVALMVCVFAALSVVFVGSGVQTIAKDRILGFMRIGLGVLVAAAGCSATWFYLTR